MDVTDHSNHMNHVKCCILCFLFVLLVCVCVCETIESSVEVIKPLHIYHRINYIKFVVVQVVNLRVKYNNL